MKLIFLLIIVISSSLLGLIACYLDMRLKFKKYEKKIEFYKKELQGANKKLVKIDAIIRSNRNDLLNKQTELKSTPKEKQKNREFDYIGVNANVRLMNKLEEAIRNEMY